MDAITAIEASSFIYSRLFIVSGIGRSGTSALLGAVCEHPRVLRAERPGEAPLIASLAGFLCANEIENDSSDYFLKNYRVDQARQNQVWTTTLGSLLLTDRDRMALQAGPPGTFWPAKVSLTEQAFAMIGRVFQSVKTFYIIRNGVEVVNSTINFGGFADLSFEQACRRWAGASEQYSYLEGLADVAVVRHEQLVENPIQILDEAFAQIGLPLSPLPARWLSENFINSSFEHDGGERFSFDDRVARVLEAWSDDELSIFEKICGSEMTRLGYKFTK